MSLTKSERLALIRSRANVILGLAMVSGLMSVSRAEIREDAANVTRTTKDDCDIIDEEIAGFAPSIPEEKASVTVLRESEILLTEKEKRQVRRDVDAVRWQEAKKRNSWLIISA